MKTCYIKWGFDMNRWCVGWATSIKWKRGHSLGLYISIWPLDNNFIYDSMGTLGKMLDNLRI